MIKKVLCIFLLAAMVPAMVIGQTSPTPTPLRTATPTIGIPYHFIPCTIEAENYWESLDTTTGNAGGAYKSGDVDIETCSEGGYNVGWIVAGEWLGYNLMSKYPGVYDIEARVARQPSGNASMHVTLAGTDVTGSMIVPSTGGWQNWVTVKAPGIVIGYGAPPIKVIMDSSDFNLNWIRFTQTASYRKLTLIKEGAAANQAIVTLAPAGLSGDQFEDRWFPEGTVVEIRIALPSATPCDCPHPYFAGFSGDPVTPGSNGIYTVTMDSDKTVFASFEMTSGSATPTPTPTITPTVFIPTSTNTPTATPTPSGTPEYVVYSGGTVTGSLSGPGDKRIYRVVFPTDYIIQTILLNCGNANFDLYAGSTAAPNLTTFSACSANPAGEVLDVRGIGTTAYIMVYCVSGSGSYTMSSTAVMGPTPTPTTGSPTPYKITLPGSFESEDYSRFLDLSAGNSGGVYRTDDVDIEACSEGGYDVSWIEDTEWLEYDAMIGSSPIRADFEARVAKPGAGTSYFHLEIDGINITGPIPVLPTYGDQAWTSVAVPGLYLPGKAHRIRTVFDTGAFKINWCKFSNPAGWIPYTLTPSQVSITFASGEVPYARVNVTFPDAGYRISEWPTMTAAGTSYTVDIKAEKYTGASSQVVTSMSHDYGLGYIPCPAMVIFTVKSYDAFISQLSYEWCTPTAPPTVPPTPTPTPTPTGVSQFHDNFNDNALGGAWSLYSGTWSESGGILRQDSKSQGDPCKAILRSSGIVLGANQTLLAKVYVDSWTNGDSARVGISLFTATGNGRGYNLLFHNNHSTVQFLDDGAAWGPAYTFTWTDKTWYWFRLKMENGTLSGKVWKDGAAEPATWPYVWARSGLTGYPALNGGTSGHGGSCTVFFDDVTLTSP